MIDHEQVWRARGMEEERWTVQHVEDVAREKKKAEKLQAWVDEVNKVFEPQFFNWVKAMLIRCWRVR